jgi:hypothetical protein
MKLNSLILKIVACICMTIDHIGELFFPEVSIFKIIGRLAFPLFAFFIAEGCKYTRNRLRRLLEILCLGIMCETVYIIHGILVWKCTTYVLIINYIDIYSSRFENINYTRRTKLKKSYFNDYKFLC